MSAERRRIIAIVAAIAVVAAAGVFWLARLVFGATTDARLEADVGASVPSASVAVSTPDTLPSGEQPLPDDAASPEPTSGQEPASAAGTTGSGTPGGTSSSNRSSSPAAPPAPKTRTVEVGGVTLNNRNPRTMCTEFHNTLGIAVTLSNIGVSGDLTVDPVKCAGQSDVNGSECLNGKPLSADGFCFVGVVPTLSAPDEYRGEISVKVTGVCTSTGPSACSGSELGTPPPSAPQPVKINWIETSEPVCHAIRAPDEDNQSEFCFEADNE